MSEVNKINLNDTLFDIEDTVARENITTMQANIANDLDACSLVAEEDKSIAGAYAVQQLNRSLTTEIFDLSSLTYQQALDQLLTFENVPVGQTRTFMILSSDCGYQLAKATAFNTDWISGTSTPAVAVGDGGKSYVFSRFISGGASTEISPFSSIKEQTVTQSISMSGENQHTTYTFVFDELEEVKGISQITKQSTSSYGNAQELIPYGVTSNGAYNAGAFFNISSNVVKITLLNHVNQGSSADWTITAVGF